MAKAKEMMALYTNNKVATMQEAGDFDGIIAMADAQLEKNPASACSRTCACRPMPTRRTMPR